MNATTWRGLSYTALERLIVDLHRAQPEAIRARFRKLRLRPFPDDIRSGRGARVAYDLSRIIAILAVFELNSLHVPQGHAAAIVEATWPEWCRACIAAACEQDLMARPRDMPRRSVATVTILPDAFATEPAAVAARATEPAPQTVAASGARICVDVSRLVSALAGVVPARQGELAAAFAELELSHGWTRRTFPTQSELAEVARGRGFLEEGPYVQRALALLDAELDYQGIVVEQQRARMQAFLEYIEDPAPIDAWKVVTGIDAGSPRLGHLLLAWAIGIGLSPGKRMPETVVALDAEEASERARAFLTLIG